MSKIIWIDIKEVLENWDSIDGIKPPIIKNYKEFKSDSQYEDVKESIYKYGFRRPLTYRITDNIIYHGDGHHRLIAAWELGYKKIPYRKYNNIDCNAFVSNDSWGYNKFHEHKIKKLKRQYLHPDNPLPVFLVK